MKPSSLAPVLLAATLFLSPALHAEEDTVSDEMTQASDNQEMGKQQQADILKRFDKNGDGKLDEDEKAAAKEYNREAMTARQGRTREALNKKALAKFDKNGDGKLDDTERAEAIKAFETDPRLVKRFDKDGDGKLNDVEKAAARDALSKLAKSAPAKASERRKARVPARLTP